MEILTPSGLQQILAFRDQTLYRLASPFQFFFVGMYVFPKIWAIGETVRKF